LVGTASNQLSQILGGEGSLSTEARLIDLMRRKTPVGGLNAEAEWALAQSQGAADRTIGGMPIPEGSPSLEQFHAAKTIGSIVQSSEPSGFTVDVTSPLHPYNLEGIAQPFACSGNSVVFAMRAE
jgi:hypothetical protein